VTVAVVLSNVIYPLAAIAVAALVGAVIALRHRRPKSVESNMESFNRGLRALAPDSQQTARRRGRTRTASAYRPAPTPASGQRSPLPPPVARPVRTSRSGPRTEADTG
jgi:hypothetical protein